jgi:hypothetical protein
MCFYMIVWSLKGLESLPLFVLVTFFQQKNSIIVKDAIIFHFKLGGSRRPSYFLTSTPSKHTFHYHARPIASS